jgi:hypothetical protein
MTGFPDRLLARPLTLALEGHLKPQRLCLERVGIR